MRSRPGGKLVKARRRQSATVKVKRRKAPEIARRLTSSPAGHETKLALLTRERNEALARQAATSEVLQVISSSPGELRQVFESMLKNAVRICGAKFGNLWRREGNSFRIAATHGAPPAYADYRRREPNFHPAAGTLLGRLVTTSRVVHIADVSSEDAYAGRNPSRVGSNAIDARYLVELAGARTVVAVPMIRENELIGAIIIYRQEVQPFTEKQIDLVKNFAAQAVIAVENARLMNELHQRTDELGRSVGELRALGEVSQAVNSTLDLETVLSTIVAKAVQLSSTEAGAIYVFDDQQREFHLRATYGMDQELIEALRQQRIGLMIRTSPLASWKVSQSRCPICAMEFPRLAARSSCAPGSVRCW